MHLSNLISRWNSELAASSNDKKKAAEHVVPELSNEDLFIVLSIIVSIDSRVSISPCLERSIGDNARLAIIDWLVRTDTDELIRLSNADLAAHQTLVNTDEHQAPLGDTVIELYLTESELSDYSQILFNSDWASMCLHRCFREIARLRQVLARQGGASTR